MSVLWERVGGGGAGSLNDDLYGTTNLNQAKSKSPVYWILARDHPVSALADGTLLRDFGRSLFVWR